MLNSVIMQGRLTKDVELRYTNNETPVASFTLAVERDYNPGEEKQTDFVNCTAWRKTAENIDRFFSKGSQILITGRLQSRKYIDKDGNNRTAWEVVVEHFNFCDKKNSTPSVEEQQPATTASPYSDFASADVGDLPF